ncbi:GNAT family N-acetyltransferase [Aurantibacter sp.]|uniref:GNAT family N-acetyltransferase n=1 Tax=Aurantibacter sp. TaxID=2807103 RepID=UPI003265A34C
MGNYSKTSKYVLEPYQENKSLPELERLYESSYAVTAFGNISYGEQKKYTFSVLNEKEQVTDVILFGTNKNKVEVINQLCSIDDSVLNMFSKTVFENFNNIRKISFQKQYAKINSEEYHSYATEMNDDYIIDLPENIATYRSLLGKNIKRNINSSINRLKRDFADFEITFYEKENVPVSIIEKAFELNQLRMKKKGKASLQNAEMNRRMIERVKAHGLVSSICVEGRVASVIVNTIVGGHLYFHIISHDPKYDYYRLGQVNLYLTIKHFLEQGGKKFHLLWGEYDYKYQFKGEKHLLYSYDLLRKGESLNWEKTKHKTRKTVNFLKGITPQKVISYSKRRLSKRIKA